MNIVKRIGIVICFFMITGCDEAEDLIEQEVTVDANFVIDLSIGIVTSGNSDLPDFGRGVSYDVLSTPEVVELVGTPDRIKKVRINSVIYEYTNFSGNVDTNVNGTFVFATGPGVGDGFSTPTVNVAQADLLGDVFRLSGNFDAVSEHVSNVKKVDFSYAGFASDHPAGFIVRVTISASVTVELNASDL